MKARRAAIVLAVMSLLCPFSQARAADPRLDLEIRLQRVWFGPQAPLALEIDLTSKLKDPIPNLRASVAIYERVRTRSELRDAYEGKVPRTPLQAFTYRLEDLPPGATQRIKVEEGLSALPAFQGAPDGLYPVSVTVRQSTGPAITSSTTAVALVSEPPENPMRLVAVLALVPPPLLNPAGAPRRDTREQLAGLRRRITGMPIPEMPYGLAVSPVLLEELRAMRAMPVRAEAAELEAALREAARGAELLTLPFAYAELAHLPDLSGADGLREQLSSGRAALRRAFGTDPSRVLFPPDLQIDQRSLQALRSNEIDGAVVSGSMTAATSRGLTPAEVVSSAGVQLLPSDALLREALLAARTDTDIGRAAAETAMIYFESPARQRTIVVSPPIASQPVRLAAFIGLLRDAPWLSVVAPTEAGRPQGRPLRSIRYPEASRPPRSFTRNLSEAKRSVAEMSAFTVEGNPAAESFGAALGAAVGTAWWNDDWARGTAWARGIVAAVDGQRRLVRTSRAAPVTFTSRRGEVPITVVNRTAYPVRIRIEISSPKLKFPHGSAKLLAPLNPPGETVTFTALTDATGTFPLKVRLTSPDGAVVVHEEELVVRSTAFNVLALVITVGAALFFVGWYGRKWWTAKHRA